MQATTNLRFKYRILQSIITLLFTICCFNTITAYAKLPPDKMYEYEPGETKIVNGSNNAGTDVDESLLQALHGTDNGYTENGGTKKVSYLYWAGSIHRTGFLFY